MQRDGRIRHLPERQAENSDLQIDTQKAENKAAYTLPLPVRLPRLKTQIWKPVLPLIYSGHVCL